MWDFLWVDIILELLGNGKEGRKLREEIKRLLEKPSHLPEETLLLDRDRFARKLFWVYWIAGMGALLATYIFVRFIEGIIGPHTLPSLTELVTGKGGNLSEFPIYIVLSFIAGLPILCVASWSRRHLSRGILLGVTQEDFRNRALHTKIVFTGAMVIAFVLYGYMLHNVLDIELGVLFFPPLLGFFTFLWYLCSILFMKSRGRYSSDPNRTE
jgi:hypothetical protein